MSADDRYVHVRWTLSCGCVRERSMMLKHYGMAPLRPSNPTPCDAHGDVNAVDREIIEAPSPYLRSRGQHHD